MTWSFVQHYGSTEEKFSASSMQVFSPVEAIPAGRVLICSIASDNVQTADGNSSLISSVVGSYSGIFTKLGEYTNGQGAAGAGITVSVWARRVLEDIPGGYDTITINLANPTVARCAYVTIYHASGSTLSVGAVQGSANDTDPAEMTLSGLSNREWLLLRVDATERESFGYISSTNYTDLGTTTTTGGDSESNVSIGSEYRVATVTGDTTNPTTGTPQSASLYIALSDEIIGYSMPADPGSYTITGVDVTFSRSYVLPAETGSYTITGFAADLLYPRTLNAETGSYTITGYDINVPLSYTLDAAPGSYTITGNAAELLINRSLPAETGSYTITGIDAEFNRTVVLNCEPGSYSITGYNIPESITTVGRSKYQLMDSFYRQHVRTQSEIRATLGSTHHTTTPKKDAQNAAKQAEIAAQKARQRRLRALMDEMLEIEAEIADFDELLNYNPEFPIHKPAFEQLTPVALYQQLGYTSPEIKEDEAALELLLLNII